MEKDKTIEERIETAETDRDILKALQEDVAQIKAQTMKPQITKEQILEEKNTAKRLKLIKENIDLFIDE